MNTKLQRIITAAMLAAMTAVATLIIRIPTLGTNGYINTGDAVVLISAWFMGNPYGALAAGIGVLGVLLKRKKRLKKEAELEEKNGGPGPDPAQPGAQTPAAEPVTEEPTAEKTKAEEQASIDQVKNQPEERNDDNGDNGDKNG